MTKSRFERVGETARPVIHITLNGEVVEVLAGDTLMTAILTHWGQLRVSEFGDGPRAGFCLMGACQDCWVRLQDGRRIRACTTPAADGMVVLTGAEEIADAP